MSVLEQFSAASPVDEPGYLWVSEGILLIPLADIPGTERPPFDLAEPPFLLIPGTFNPPAALPPLALMPGTLRPPASLELPADPPFALEPGALRPPDDALPELLDPLFYIPGTWNAKFIRVLLSNSNY